MASLSCMLSSHSPLQILYLGPQLHICPNVWADNSQIANKYHIQPENV